MRLISANMQIAHKYRQNVNLASTLKLLCWHNADTCRVWNNTCCHPDHVFSREAPAYSGRTMPRNILHGWCMAADTRLTCPQKEPAHCWGFTLNIQPEVFRFYILSRKLWWLFGLKTCKIWTKSWLQSQPSSSVLHPQTAQTQISTGSGIWTTKQTRVKQGGYMRANRKFRLDEMRPPQFVKHCIAGAAGCLWQAQIRVCGVSCLSVIDAGYTTV